MFVYYFIIFTICAGMLYFAGNLVVSGLSRLAKLLHWKEFVIAFFVMALAASLPNLFLAIMSVINKVPELSLGDVMGGNVVDMTLAIALATFFSKKGVNARGKTTQTSLIFTAIAAVLPLVLLFDNNLSQLDGVILLFLFFIYLYWLVSKKDRFQTIYSGHPINIGKNNRLIAKEMFLIFAGALILAGAAQTIIWLAGRISLDVAIPLPLVGILIIGFGNSLPEIYFSIAAAKANKTRLILGDIMGAVILPSTLVLGLVALISPFSINDANMFLAARYFLLAGAGFFFICVKTDQIVTKKEAILLLSVYIAFLLTEVLAK